MIPRSGTGSVPNYPELPFGSSFRPNTSPVLQARDLLPTDPKEGLKVRQMEDSSWPKRGEHWDRPTVGLGNSVWNPRARPMLPDTLALHNRDEAHMKPFIQEQMELEGFDLHAETEKQLSTANVGTVKAPSRLMEGDQVVGAHHEGNPDAGQFGLTPEENRGLGRRIIDWVALAWSGGKGKAQHAMRSLYEGHGDGAPFIESEAAAKNHGDDGRLLPGGGTQRFFPQGLWKEKGGTHEEKGLKRVGTKHESEPF